MKMELALTVKVQVVFKVVRYAGTRVGKDAIGAADPAMMEREIRVVKFAFRKEQFHVVVARGQVQIMLANVTAVMVVVRQHSKSAITAIAENLPPKFRSWVCVFCVKERVG